MTVHKSNGSTSWRHACRRARTLHLGGWDMMPLSWLGAARINQEKRLSAELRE